MVVDDEQTTRELAKVLCNALTLCMAQRIFATRSSNEQTLSLLRGVLDTESITVD